MKAIDFIKNKLNNLISNFPQLKVSYEFDSFTNSHFIEVLPAKLFYEDIKYSRYESKLIFDFISMFPNEEIVFVTKDDLIEITKPIYIKEGRLFINEVLYWNSNVWPNDFELNFNIGFNFLSDTKINSIDLLPSSFKIFGNNDFNIRPIKEEPVEIIQDDDFALAA